MSDQNKTVLTHDVTAAMHFWMSEKGFKPIETEVPVCGGWCADLAAVLVPTQTELINLKLLERQPSWNERYSTQDGQRRRVWDEARTLAWQQRCRELAYRTCTTVVEVKTSRGDFRGDHKWTAAIPADMAFLAVPTGLIRQEEWPHGWGIVEVNDGSARMRRAPTIQRVADFQRTEVILSIAVRRDHHTRYERHREFQREHRDQENERKSLARVRDVVKMVTSILRGECSSLDDVLLRQGEPLRNLPGDLREELAPFYGIRPRTEEELAAEIAQHVDARLRWEESAAERRKRLEALA